MEREKEGTEAMTDRITPQELAQMNSVLHKGGYEPGTYFRRLIREVSQLNIELIRAREEVSLLTEERDGLVRISNNALDDNEKLRAALRSIARCSDTDPNRTFDNSIRDFGLIQDIARAALGDE